MAYIEKQRHGNHDYYYLVRSVRLEGGKVKKVRVFLGRKVPQHGKLQELFRKLEGKLPKKYRPVWLPAETAERLDDLRGSAAKFYELPAEQQGDFLVRFTYNTNAIEGNPLTLRQTALILNDGIAPQGSRAQDVVEVYNGKDAWLFAKGHRSQLNAAFLRKLQYEVTKNTKCRLQGKFRDSEVRITGSEWTPPAAKEVPKLVDAMLEAFRAKKGMHPVESASWLHNRAVQIHPFTDGNGRTARLVMNWVLMKRGFPPVVIDTRNKERYYSMIEKADAGNHRPFAEFLAAQMLEQYTKKK